MTSKYVAITTLSIDQFSVILEEETLNCPAGYDEESTAPQIRIILSGDQTNVGTSLKEIAEISLKSNFPLAGFFYKFPGEVAAAIAAIEGLRRPIRDNPLFHSLEQEAGIKLQDIEPTCKNGMLTWFELHVKAGYRLQRRCVSVAAIEFIECPKEN